MSEKYIVVSDDEYCYTLDTQAEGYRTLEDFEKEEFENAKKENIDVKEHEDEILESAHDKYWEWVYDNHLEPDTVNDIMNALVEEKEQLKQELFEVSKELLYATSDDVDRVLYYEDEVEELRKEIFE